MNKRKLLILVIVAAVVAGAGMYGVSRQQKSEDKTAPTANTYPAGSKKACDMLSFSAAKTFLGGDAVRNTTVPGGGAGSTEDVAISSCTYDKGEGSADRITLTVRAAHGNQIAYSTNRYAFEDARVLAPGSTDSEMASEDIPALGDDAYYNPSTDQTNVLIHDGQYWLVIQASDRDTQRKVGARILNELGL
jgi:hypothetical protein